MNTAWTARDPWLDALRDRRATLRGELSRVGHWRRLLRAKIDLTVARGAGPDPLKFETAPESLPDSGGLPTSDILQGLCFVDGTGFLMSQLPSLKTADTQLSDYEVELRSELMSATDELVSLLAGTALHTFETPTSSVQTERSTLSPGAEAMRN